MMERWKAALGGCAEGRGGISVVERYVISIGKKIMVANGVSKDGGMMGGLLASRDGDEWLGRED